MNNEELIDFLKKNLKIKLNEYRRCGESYGESGIKATLYLGDEKISSSKVTLETY